MDEGLKDMKLTEQEEERRMEEEEERRMEREEERRMEGEEEKRMEGEEEEMRMEEVEMEKGDKNRGENLCPAFSSNDSKAVDLFFNVVPGIEVQYLKFFTLVPFLFHSSSPPPLPLCHLAESSAAQLKKGQKCD
jgi:hypothetical protein